MTKPKIVVLGGAGDMGGRVAAELAASSEVVVVIADYREQEAQKKAGAMPGGVSARFVDATNRESLLETMRGAGCVVNCIGPFYRYAQQVALAAIQAGVCYLDICDDDDATLQLLSLDGMARQRGVGLLTGIGWTPGISNLLAKHAADQMDAVDEIDLTWVGSTSDSEGLAVIKHVIHAVTRETLLYSGYQWGYVHALEGVRDVEFPAPIGTVPAYYCGHPEPVTLPRFIDGLRSVAVRGYLLPAEIQQLVKTLIVLEMVNSEKKIDALTDLLQPLLPVLSNLGEKAAPPLSAIRVDVRGALNGRPHSLSYCAMDSMERLTGIPPAVAALMVIRGEVVIPPGVYALEGCLSPPTFLAELAKRDIEIEEVTSGGAGFKTGD